MIKQASNLSPADKQNIIKMFTAGTAAGGAAGLAVSLGHYLKKLRQRSEEVATDDDDTLYLNLKRASQGESLEDSPLAPGLAIAGGALGSLGGYMLVRKMYNKMRRNQLQAELDESQTAYVKALSDEKLASSEGSRPMTPGENFIGLPTAALILTALGGGVLTHKLLDQAYPRPKAPTRVGPRRVVFRRADGEEDKTASITDQDANEFLAMTVLAQPGLEKVSSLPDLVSAVADGRCLEVAKNVREYGWDTAFETIKGASRELSDFEKVCSVRLCFENPILSPGFGVHLASEFSEMAPTYVKLASALSPDVKESLEDVMAHMQVGFKTDTLQASPDELPSETDTLQSTSDEEIERTLMDVLPIDLMDRVEERKQVEQVEHAEESVSSEDAT